MKNYRRYKNCKIETICQMEVVTPPKPKIIFGTFGGTCMAGMATWQNNVPQGWLGYQTGYFLPKY